MLVWVLFWILAVGKTKFLSFYIFFFMIRIYGFNMKPKNEASGLVSSRLSVCSSTVVIVSVPLGNVSRSLLEN